MLLSSDGASYSTAGAASTTGASAAVVAGAAERHGMNVLCVETDYDETIAEGSSQWLLLTCNDEFINDDAITQYVTPNEEYTSSRIVWTDQYSNLLEVLQ